MSKVSSIENPVKVRGAYRERVLTVEPHGIEQVPASERLAHDGAGEHYEPTK